MVEQSKLTTSQKRFNNNLVELSEENEYEKCIDEWSFIEYFKKDDYDNNCLCGRPLMNQYYYINEKTGKIICSGKDCRQKLERLEKKTRNQKIKDISKMISLNGIKNIGDFDLVEYCRRNFKIIIELFLNEVRNHKNINDLDNYKKYLMEEWSSLFDIKILLDEIEKLILNIVKEENLKKRERREKEIFERETREKERLEKERKLNMFKEKIRKERENKREIKKKRRTIYIR